MKNKEFDIFVFYKYLTVGKEIIDNDNCEFNDIAVVIDSNDEKLVGKSLTKLGPASFIGDILDDPELLWTEDVWDEQRYKVAHEKINLQGNNISKYWKDQYNKKAGTFWHEFYRRNTDKFYKDRHYLHVVFPELLDSGTDGKLSLLEVGSGVGNAVLPLLELNKNIFITCIDFAKSAIDILKKNITAINATNRLKAFVFDIVNDDFSILNSFNYFSNNDENNNDENNKNDNNKNDNNNIAINFVNNNNNNYSNNNTNNINNNYSNNNNNMISNENTEITNNIENISFDIVLCMFVLSAIDPFFQSAVLKKLYNTMNKNAFFLFRDYGRFLKKKYKLNNKENFCLFIYSFCREFIYKNNNLFQNLCF
jgi:hypothetical protein